MTAYSLTQLANPVLLRELCNLIARDRNTTALLLAHIGEVDARKLYLPAAHPSMFAYCVRELRFSEDSAYRHITAARAARQFPVLFDAVAQGKLHLTAVILLAPHLASGNIQELLQAAAHKTKFEIEQLLAQRFPRTEMFQMVQPIPASGRSDAQLAPERVEANATEGCPPTGTQLAPERVEGLAPRQKLTPIASDRFALQLTVGQNTYDKLRYAQSLLSHQVPSGDMAEVLDLALEALIRQLEKRKFAATKQPRERRAHPSEGGGCSSEGGRHVPAHVKRLVWDRDGGQCTFSSDAGHRCEARKLLEFDHIDEVARGGKATVARMRLRCRAHNQYTAECTFGPEFMSNKREEARRAAAARTSELDVIPWLRALGFRAEEARRAAAHCELIPHASLEERVRRALAFLAPRAVTQDFRPAQNALGTAA